MVSRLDNQGISHVSEPKDRRYLLCHLQKDENRLIKTLSTSCSIPSEDPLPLIRVQSLLGTISTWTIYPLQSYHYEIFKGFF